MPRVENTGENVGRWCETHGREHGTTRDVCAGCHARLDSDPHCFDQVLVPDGPDEPRGSGGWGGDVDHPPYAYCPATCAVCGAGLTSIDDRRAQYCSTRTPDIAAACHHAGIRVRKDVRS